jgi:two-component system LytT family sensor kinase
MVCTLSLYLFAAYQLAMTTGSSLFGNTLWHCGGLIVFSMLLYVFFLEAKRSKRFSSGLSAGAAVLGLLWNIGDLAILAPGLQQNPAVQVLHAISFSALCLLPAVLLHAWLRQRYAPLRIGGYLVGLAAAMMHILAHLKRSPSPHAAALLLIVITFGGLTAVCLVLNLLESRRSWTGWRIAAAMSLLLPAILFVYFEPDQAYHFLHLGIPLAVVVFFANYRFLLLDTFVRLSVKSIVPAALFFLCFVVESRLNLLAQNQFVAALVLAGAFVGCIVLIQLSKMAEQSFAGFMSRRLQFERALAALRRFPIADHGEKAYLRHAQKTIERFFECRFSRFQDCLESPDSEPLHGPVALLKRSKWPQLAVAPWAEAVLPLRFVRGDGLLLLFGARRGERPYRNDDLLVLARFGKIIEEKVERVRHIQTQALASKAELRALQAEINPHFFFNALNTLYGSISRDNVGARHLVLNLADVFHHLLRSDRSFISLEEELKIIKAYLEIEALRLGPKLSTAIHIDHDVLKADIPVLSIQPLVENAVKHGVMPHNSKGFVGLTVTSENNRLKVEVANTGKFVANPRAGIGLNNVRRRLTLCYGFDAELSISSKDGLTVVCCSMPLSLPVLGDDLDHIMQKTA